MFKSCEENVCCSTANWRQRIGKIKERKEEEEKTSINKIVTLKWHINYTYRWKRLIVNGECQMSNAYVNVCWLLENYHWFHTDKCTTIDVYSHVIPYQLQCIWRNDKNSALNDKKFKQHQLNECTMFVWVCVSIFHIWQTKHGVEHWNRDRMKR